MGIILNLNSFEAVLSLKSKNAVFSNLICNSCQKTKQKKSKTKK